MSDEVKDCISGFLGFESAKEGQPVQTWFDGLPPEHLDEVKDRLAALQVLPVSDWEDPLFDPLHGEGGISEIRFDKIICIRGKFYYRIYGFFDEEAYVFLHATNKKVKNDRPGKTIAKRRLHELQEGQAKIHELDLDKESPPGEIV